MWFNLRGQVVVFRSSDDFKKLFDDVCDVRSDQIASDGFLVGQQHLKGYCGLHPYRDFFIGIDETSNSVIKRSLQHLYVLKLNVCKKCEEKWKMSSEFQGELLNSFNCHFDVLQNKVHVWKGHLSTL